LESFFFNYTETERWNWDHKRNEHNYRSDVKNTSRCICM